MKKLHDHDINDVNHKAAAAAVSLPQEIILELLLKIPSPKSLMRFNCVCKSWFSLIRDYRFATMHLRRHYRPSSSSLSILVNHRKSIWDCSDCFFSVHSDDHEGQLVQCYDGLPVANHSKRHVISSCNGIVCLLSTSIHNWDKQLVHLWNPTTRELKTIPYNDLCSPYPSNYDTLNELFYEPLMDDYKVLRVHEYAIDIQVNKFGYRVDLYSSASNSLRLIDDDADMFQAGSVTYVGFSYMVDQGSSGVVNGQYLHWIAQIKHENDHPILSEWYIVCFNLQTEVFEQIKQPQNLETAYDAIKLGKLSERLTVLYNSNFMKTDILVMKEYRVTASWTKEFTIRHGVEVTTILGLENSGKLVIKYSKTPKLAWYDLKSTNPWQATELGVEVYIITVHMNWFLMFKLSFQYDGRRPIISTFS